jgi:hypothetical protein
MSLSTYVAGIGTGLLVATFALYVLSPVPTLHIADPDEKLEGVLSAKVSYARYAPLPKVMIEGNRILHHVIERIDLDSGEAGLKVTVLVDKIPALNWI